MHRKRKTLSNIVTVKYQVVSDVINDTCLLRQTAIIYQDNVLCNSINLKFLNKKYCGWLNDYNMCVSKISHQSKRNPFNDYLYKEMWSRSDWSLATRVVWYKAISIKGSNVFQKQISSIRTFSQHFWKHVTHSTIKDANYM